MWTGYISQEGSSCNTVPSSSKNFPQKIKKNIFPKLTFTQSFRSLSLASLLHSFTPLARYRSLTLVSFVRYRSLTQLAEFWENIFFYFWGKFFHLEGTVLQLLKRLNKNTFHNKVHNIITTLVLL